MSACQLSVSSVFGVRVETCDVRGLVVLSWVAVFDGIRRPFGTTSSLPGTVHAVVYLELDCRILQGQLTH